MEEEYKFIPKPTTLFSGHSYYPDEYIETHCDECFSLERFPKDRSFAEMRRDFVYERLWCCATVPLKQKTYEKIRQKHKEENKELHNLFLHGKKHKLSDLLTKFGVADFIRVPNCFKIKVTNARVLERNGNDKSFLAEDDKYFYVWNWSGS